MAVGLLLAIEGLLYAAFPGAMRRAAAAMMEAADGSLRVGGLVAAAAGVAIVWLARG